MELIFPRIWRSKRGSLPYRLILDNLSLKLLGKIKEFFNENTQNKITIRLEGDFLNNFITFKLNSSWFCLNLSSFVHNFLSYFVNFILHSFFDLVDIICYNICYNYNMEPIAISLNVTCSDNSIRTQNQGLGIDLLTELAGSGSQLPFSTNFSQWFDRVTTKTAPRTIDRRQRKISTLKEHLFNCKDTDFKNVDFQGPLRVNNT